MRLILSLKYFQGNKIHKTAFVAFFQGEQLKTRIKKVCIGFRASLYDCPTSQAKRQEKLKAVRTQLADLNLVRLSYIEINKYNSQCKYICYKSYLILLNSIRYLNFRFFNLIKQHSLYLN